MNAAFAQARRWPFVLSPSTRAHPFVLSLSKDERDRSFRAGLSKGERPGGFGRISATASFLLLAATSTAFACPQCFGAEETALVDGTRLGILVLLGIVLAVQGLFAAFFIRLRNRAKRAADLELANEWSALQREPRTS